MKTHDWKEVATQGIIKYCLQDALGNNQRATFLSFLDFLKKVHSDEHTDESIKELQLEVNLVCARIERDFPVSVQVISLHLIRHIVDGIKIQGPTHSWSMWMYERFNSWISRRVMNRKTPEATIMRTYQVHDWCQFMKASGRLPGVESPLFEMDECSDGEDRGTKESTAAESIPAPENVVNVLRYFYEIAEDEDFSTEISLSHSHSEMVFGRLIEWRGREKERSSKVSSIIELKLDAATADLKPTFGQIKHFFTNSYSGKTTKFAVVDMFEEETTVCTSVSQWTVIPGQSKMIIIPANFEYLSRPLVTAKPVDNIDILYILNR
ncbi:uncharacterized protein LOC110239599 isoform X2 [Exaiptasia diaphana]|uniref:DUF4218 domain-containing protein n=1 Tax=Exaiptasia diaphana TaxID=2652724 RepID=A0A913YKK0_EXADI|nr:uncharacterized protein LOC110239599 isoform X2 [Exaiptasia diaphana]